MARLTVIMETQNAVAASKRTDLTGSATAIAKIETRNVGSAQLKAARTGRPLREKRPGEAGRRSSPARRPASRGPMEQAER